MKKTHQNDQGLDMINLDETLGWNTLELEAELEEKKKEDFVFQGEVTISEEELFSKDTYAQADNVTKEEKSYAEQYEYDEDEAVFSQEEYDEAVLSQDEDLSRGAAVFAEDELLTMEPVRKAKKPEKSWRDAYDEDDDDDDYDDEDDDDEDEEEEPRNFGEKIIAAFRNMSALDGVVAITGVLVLVVAIVTVSIFSGAKMAKQQVEAFAPIGEDMEYVVDAGKGTLLAMADAMKYIPVEEEETSEEPTYGYDEKDLDEANVNVNMKLTSVQKDLKIKFVNHKTGKLVPNVKFKVSIEDSKNKTKEYVDDDMDGIIYINSMTSGKATVTMLALKEEDKITFNTVPQTIEIKDKIEYAKIDVSEEVKSESEVNAAIEDTAGGTQQEDTLTDTVEWVESTKTEIGKEENYKKVDKSTIPDPADLAAAAFSRMTQLMEEPEVEIASEMKESHKVASLITVKTEIKDVDSTEEEDSTEVTTESESESETETSTEEESESETEKETEEENESESESKEDEDNDDVKNDTKSLLKDKSGNQMYIKNSDGKYVKATYADYYNSKVTFYIREEVVAYKYTGWQDIDGKTYFYNKDGKYVTGEQVIQGAKYEFGEDGVLKTGAGTLGIDVSKWNGNIDWNVVKNSGVSYVIIRCGYRGSSTGAMIEDPKFKTNINGALKAGLKVGVYFFSQATNEVEAVEEASMVLGLIKGYNLTFPVFLDVEATSDNKGRADHISVSARTAVCKAFCQTIANSGYKAGIYANKTWLNSYIDTPSLTGFNIWLAQYAAEPSYTRTKYDMWQYSSKGKVAGISGNVDMNICYKNY